MSRLPIWAWALLALGVAMVAAAITLERWLGILKRSTTAAKMGDPNEPDDPQTIARLSHTAKAAPFVLAILLEFDDGAHITSGFRNDAVNAAVTGSPTSRHRLGLAIDVGDGWGLERTKAAARYLRANAHRLPGWFRFRDVLAEINHLHVEIADPFGLDDSRATRWRQQIPGLPGRKFEPLAAA